MKSEEIASSLRARIESGRLPPEQRPDDALPAGATMPTLDVIGEMYGADRNTAHQAYAQLRNAGLIHTKPGRNAIVADPSPLYLITRDAQDKARESDGLTAFEVQVRETGDTARTDHYRGRLEPAPDLGIDALGATVGELLEVSDSTPLLHLAGTGWATPVGPSGKPEPKLERVVQIYDSWMVPTLTVECPHLLGPRDDEHPWYGGAWGLIYEATGRRPQRLRHIITERITTHTESARFHTPPMTPVSAEVVVNVDQRTGALLSVAWYRRLFGVAQWDL